MIIRPSGNKYSLYRYGGSSQGKNLEVKVGLCPKGISPDAIPADLMENLTPKELKVLKDVLAKDHQEILNGKISGIVADLNDLGSALESGVVDPNSVIQLQNAASAFVKCARRVVSVQKVGNVGSTNS